MTIKTKLRSIYRPIYNHLIFTFLDRQVKNDKFPIPELIYQKNQIANVYPSIYPFYPNLSFLDAVKEHTTRLETVAVLFNSGVVLEKEWGSEIDDHNIVIRVNFMPSFGFEKHVGSKTTIRVLGRAWIFQEDQEILVHTYNDEKYLKSDLENYKTSEKLRQNALYLSKHNEINRLFQPYLGGMMTNGFRAVLIGLSLGDQVMIYGADPESKNYYKGKSLGHFPRKSELDYTKKTMQNWNISQDFDWYFNPIKNGKVPKTHNTIRREYAFYKLHPRVAIAS